MWVKIRASEAERAEWHAKARSAGLTLSDLVRRSVGRVRTWTVVSGRRTHRVWSMLDVARRMDVAWPITA